MELNQQVEIPEDHLHVPTVEEERAEMARRLIIEQTGLMGIKVEERAVAELAAMSPEQAEAFKHCLAIKLTAKRRAPSRVSEFLSALNALVRLYMARFNDFFVEEVAIFQLTGMVTSGVMMIWLVDGQVVDQIVHVGKIPGTMRGQWFDHGELAVAEFRKALRDGVLPPSATLLSVRARSLLERGAYRSAIIEASAALETIVTRRIRHGLVAAGKSGTEIHTLLKQNERFKDRAKKLLKAATGVSAAALDPRLWQQVLAHRENFRHRIAHSDLEPSQADAEKAVEHFTRLAALVAEIP